MSQQTRIGIIGAGWPGAAHARGYQEAGGFKLLAVADLIPARRQKLMADFGVAKEYASAADLLADRDIDAVSVCLPNHLHAPVAIEAMRAGKHVLCEKPPALSAKEAGQMARTAERNNRVLLFGLQRRYGPHAQAARQAIAKGYAGDVYHARTVWTRTRGIPQGTGWFTQKEKSGGGAMIDIGVHMLDLAWFLLGQPKPSSVFAVTHRKFGSPAPEGSAFDVDDAAFALVRFEGGRSIELATSWAINQPPSQNGAVCRIYGDRGAVEVYGASGPTLYSGFEPDGKFKEHPLKPPRLVGHAALMRHFRQCIAGDATPSPGGADGIAIMEMIEGIYRSADSGRSVSL
jgi:predicted dehydrogenase